MTEPPPVHPDIETLANAIAILNTMLTPRQLLLLATRMQEIDLRGYGEIHLIWSSGQVDRMQVVSSDKLHK